MFTSGGLGTDFYAVKRNKNCPDLECLNGWKTGKRGSREICSLAY